jgi:hypothetical protein
MFIPRDWRAVWGSPSGCTGLAGVSIVQTAGESALNDLLGPFSVCKEAHVILYHHFSSEVTLQGAAEAVFRIIQNWLTDCACIAGRFRFKYLLSCFFLVSIDPPGEVWSGTLTTMFIYLTWPSCHTMLQGLYWSFCWVGC